VQLARIFLPRESFRTSNDKHQKVPVAHFSKYSIYASRSLSNFGEEYKFNAQFLQIVSPAKTSWVHCGTMLIFLWEADSETIQHSRAPTVEASVWETGRNVQFHHIQASGEDSAGIRPIFYGNIVLSWLNESKTGTVWDAFFFEPRHVTFPVTWSVASWSRHPFLF
jgi:hypothetical protein